ncbi:MAG TPA: hypothetical protein VN442_15295 [Bryobacteraceae bacterium]|nr:hypothetical protein [Bryobacteraceae bacterium]
MPRIAVSIFTILLCAGLAQGQEWSTDFKLSGKLAGFTINTGGDYSYNVRLEPVELADGTEGYLVSWGGFGQAYYDISGLAPFSAVKIVSANTLAIDIDIPNLLRVFRQSAWRWDPMYGYMYFTPTTAPLRGTLTVPADRGCSITRTTGTVSTESWNGPVTRTTTFHGSRTAQSCAVFTGLLIDQQITSPLTGTAITSIGATMAVSKGNLTVTSTTNP